MAMESSALITCLIATLLVPVVLSCTLESDEERVMRLFTRWKGSHSVNYRTAAEDAQRLAYFANHVRHADELAKTYGVEDADEFGRPTVFGGWADLAREEMDSLVGGLGPATVTDTGLPPFDFSTRASALFARWKSEHNVSYSSETEEAMRYANFQCYVRHADGSGRRADADTDAYGRQMRFSGWADLSPAEMSLLVGRTLPDGRKLYGRRGLRAAGLSLRDWHWSIMSSMGGFFQSFVVADPPLSFDWRNDSRAIITRAKYQGRCGGCWAFAAAGAVEGAWRLSSNISTASLSAQQLLSCDTGFINDGCDGGFSSMAIRWLSNDGVKTAIEFSYPFSPVVGGNVSVCNHSSVAASGLKVTQSLFIPSNERTIAAMLAAYGPMIAAVHINSTLTTWENYDAQTIISNCINDGELDHEVLLVGFGESALLGQYWIAKNSWCDCSILGSK